MSLLYGKEHFSCLNYDKGGRLMVEVKEIIEGVIWKEETKQNKIVFLLEGQLSFCDNVTGSCMFKEKQMLFIRFGSHFTFRSNHGNAKILIVRLTQNIRFCEHYLLETLMNQMSEYCAAECKKGQKPCVLDMTEEICSYASFLLPCLEKGLACRYYLEAKIKELFYLLRAFYSKENLAMFFREVLTDDAYFHYYVISNHHKYNTLSQMANDMNMTMSAIEKKFKQVFGNSGYRWMTEQKAIKIYKVICTEQTPLKDIAADFGFSSKSSFSDFCKKNLGDTPGEIRKNVRLGKFNEQRL